MDRANVARLEKEWDGVETVLVAAATSSPTSVCLSATLDRDSVLILLPITSTAAARMRPIERRSSTRTTHEQVKLWVLRNLIKIGYLGVRTSTPCCVMYIQSSKNPTVPVFPRGASRMRWLHEVRAWR